MKFNTEDFVTGGVGQVGTGEAPRVRAMDRWTFLRCHPGKFKVRAGKVQGV